MIVHFLKYGQTPCHMRGVPGSWPPGHIWSGAWSNVTCEACTDARRDADAVRDLFGLAPVPVTPAPAAAAAPSAGPLLCVRPLGCYRPSCIAEGRCRMDPAHPRFRAAPAAPPPATSTSPVCLVEGGVCDFTGEGDGRGPCVGRCWYASLRLLKEPPPAPPAPPIGDADAEWVTYQLGLLLGMAANVDSRLSGFLVYLTDVEAGRRSAVFPLGAPAAEVRAIVEALLPFAKVAAGLFENWGSVDDPLDGEPPPPGA